MRYMIMFYDQEPATQPTDAEIAAEMELWFAYDKALTEAGIVSSSEALQPTRTATTVRVKGDERIVTDGPFAEAREVLGGFYVLDCPDLDTVLDWAAKAPVSSAGCVEVRPVMVFDEFTG
jgi:hypothetical protein